MQELGELEANGHFPFAKPYKKMTHKANCDLFQRDCSSKLFEVKWQLGLDCSHTCVEN